jgi:hypothetical protein
MAMRVSLRSWTTMLTILLLATVVMPVDAKDRWRHMAVVATKRGNRGGIKPAVDGSALVEVKAEIEQHNQEEQKLQEDEKVLAEDTEKIDELEAEKEVLEEEVEQSFATRLADALTGDADDYTPLMWVFAFGIVLVVVSAGTGMVIMSSIIKGSVGRAELGQMNDLNFLKLKQRAQGLSVKNIKGAARV